MAILSTFTLIRSVSLCHITVAYFFLTAPRMVADQNVVFILGESMRVPHVTSLDKPNEASAFIAVLLAFIGISDFTAASLNEETSFQYWLANVPARLMFLFALTSYTYLFKEDGIFGSGPSGRGGVGANLQNSMVLSWALAETAVWFWIFTSLREERREFTIRRLEQLKREEERL